MRRQVLKKDKVPKEEKRKLKRERTLDICRKSPSHIQLPTHQNMYVKTKKKKKKLSAPPKKESPERISRDRAWRS